MINDLLNTLRPVLDGHRALLAAGTQATCADVLASVAACVRFIHDHGAALEFALTREVVPASVEEALQRLIENGAVAGPATRDDCILVGRYRDVLMAGPHPGWRDVVRTSAQMLRRAADGDLDAAQSRILSEQLNLLLPLRWPSPQLREIEANVAAGHMSAMQVFTAMNRLLVDAMASVQRLPPDGSACAQDALDHK